MSATTYSLRTLLGEKLLTQDGHVSTSELEGKTIALYFSAKWCPPCKVFTPILLASQQAAIAAGAAFEIVFISSDHDEDGFTTYFGGMKGWKAVEFEGDEAAERRTEIKGAFGCKGIPQLTVLLPKKDAAGAWTYELKTNDGKNMVMKEKEKQLLEWCGVAAAPAPAAAPAGDAFSLDEDF